MADVFTCFKAQVISEPMQLEQYIVIADYKKQNRSEISVLAGDIVEVIDKNENGTNFTYAERLLCIVYGYFSSQMILCVPFLFFRSLLAVCFSSFCILLFSPLLFICF